jgi:hypothetical protein
LDEIRKFRSLLASVAKVQLSDANTFKSTTTKKSVASTTMKSILTETSNNYQSRTLPDVPEFIVRNQWEDDMLNKYQDLLVFPLDKSINDRTMILLVLAYQMNTIRCWCEIGDGALAKVSLHPSILNQLIHTSFYNSIYLTSWKDQAAFLTGVNI